MGGTLVQGVSNDVNSPYVLTEKARGKKQSRRQSVRR